MAGESRDAGVLELLRDAVESELLFRVSAEEAGEVTAVVAAGVDVRLEGGMHHGGGAM
ncbi:uncharacterized protein H6S33_003332 [Morchella sextelata]|uniref:uncharacterized protein n=1 Tax=Morchella sextelata TaxID=1174677 RepID=UPI001D05418C|nr:uncharacterized protein H6S33_003332 [Morchella sextelata]KAH0606498.1 hypothetical protein H6S33_003332 [Morchella sextelata]